MNKPDWMLFVREMDAAMFCFNGKWPLAITPDADPWGSSFVSGNKTEDVVEATEERIDHLQYAMENTKRIFTIDKIRYRVIQRGNFITL
jgi:hypothetical protein